MTNPIINGTYDLTTIISKDAIDDPSKWLAVFNTQMSGVFIVTFLIVFGIVLYLIMRTNDNTTETKAVVYAGLISSIIGVFIFVVNISAFPAMKLLTWWQLLPILIITAAAIFIDKTNRTF